MLFCEKLPSLSPIETKLKNGQVTYEILVSQVNEEPRQPCLASCLSVYVLSNITITFSSRLKHGKTP